MNPAPDPQEIPPGPVAGDQLPRNGTIIEIRVRELQQLFNAIDPSPFHERDLDPAAEEFIVTWASHAPAAAPLGLLVHLEHSPGGEAEAEVLREAVRQHFGRRRDGSRLKLRELFRRGRISLLIGLTFLGATSGLANALSAALVETGIGTLIREGLLIGGWVAMWRPLEVFLYDWWPIRAEAARFDRLAAMPVRIQYAA